MKNNTELSPEQHEKLIPALKIRFEKNRNCHIVLTKKMSKFV
ncbi:MAG: hypothetical protein ACI83H_001322 [Glaciecola sp.]|jgi:hypothetical protein